MEGSENIRRFLHIRERLDSMTAFYRTNLQEFTAFQDLVDELVEISGKMIPEDWTEVTSLNRKSGDKIPKVEDCYTNSEY